jgi:hypothetical protein
VRDRGQARLRVRRVRRRIPVDRAEVAASVDERVAAPERLRQPDQRLILRRVVDQVGALDVAVAEPEQDASLDRVQPVVEIGDQGPIPSAPTMIGMPITIRIAPMMSKTNPLRTICVIGTTPEP